MQKIHSAKVSFDQDFAKNLKIAIVRTDYHKEYNNNLENACRKTLIENGVQVKHIATFSASGSWEIPLVTQAVAKSGKFDAIVTFGVIIKGETYHFDMIANECARALMQLSLDCSMPIAIEVLAVNNMEQARARASNDDENKGIEGALAVLKTLNTLKDIR